MATLTAMPLNWPSLDGEGTDEELVTAAMQGDDLALDLILQRYRPFVRRRARRYFIPGADSSDVVQEGMIGLFKAVSRFDPSAERPFRPFADLCVTHQILNAITSATRMKSTMLTSALSFATLQDDEDEEYDPAEQVQRDWADPESALLWREQSAALKRFLDTALTSLEREVLMRYLEGQPYEAISETLGRSFKSVDNALQRARRKVAFFFWTEG